MQGRRAPLQPNGWLGNLVIGDYGRSENPNAKGRNSWWQVKAPDGSEGCLDPSIHTVIEHEDGTITVSPSIDFSKRKLNGWHGWLERGVWRSC